MRCSLILLLNRMKARVRGDEYATYHIGIVVKEEYKNKEKLSISDTDVSVYAPSNENNGLEHSLSGEPLLHSSCTSLDLRSADKGIKQLLAFSSNDPVKQTEEMSTSLTNSSSQSSNISSNKLLP
jgi:hypothetical protein